MGKDQVLTFRGHLHCDVDTLVHLCRYYKKPTNNKPWCAHNYDNSGSLTDHCHCVEIEDLINGVLERGR